MYIDPGADTPEGYAISRTSRALAREVIGDQTVEDRIRQRCAIAVGDFVMADLVRFRGDGVAAGLEALGRGAPIVADIHMVQMGIRKKEHASEVLCALDFGAEISAERGITRSSAGFIALRHRLDGSIAVIGNAPSSLLSLCAMIREGVRPALVIGMPVGFVHAAGSKEELRGLDVPSITTQGTRGGTPPAVAAMNEIVTLFVERQRAA
ncbi:MAG: precorrin-8X/cobalt-precorrin-8 methylmutase [Methanofollis sp.]|nr:precorrin-8X/cobalt-precorrin-8 methylmutase [Methanofollis sp.]